ncbi:MAG: hypothetical protein PHO27_08515 [Sulfuricurvum sp.]|nr:hypothetical protein [Sulfuricurvum sp.]
MLDIHSLERRWIKYKIKSYLPYIIAVFVFILILLGSLYSIHSKKTTLITKNISKKTHIISPTQNKEEENITLVEPSMGFVQSLQNTLPATIETIKPIVHNNVPLTKTSIVPPTKVLKVPQTQVLTVPENITPNPQSQIVITEKSLTMNHNSETKLDIDELQRRFKDTSNANLGLFIARYYYDIGNYSEAYNYALKTNASNSKIDDSWIIFSKSLVKLGKSEQAKKTLQLYISQSNSENAKSLLDSIEKGNFK